MTSESIYTILSSIDHNEHHLRRYLKFINSCSIKNSVGDLQNVHKHHICPKAKMMFPQYASFSKYSWNCSILTYRQHVIAHYMLAKAYDNWAMWEAVNRTANSPITTKRPTWPLLRNVYCKIKETKKGVFTRGYDEYGNPNVKQSTRDKISKLKTEYYSNPENIEKQKEIRSRPCYDNANIEAVERFTNLNISRSGIPLQSEHKDNISVGLKVFWLSPDSDILRKKNSDLHRGNSYNLGRKHTEETRHNQSLRQSGENNPMFGKTHTEEARAKIVAANLGRTHTEEAKKNMSIAAKNRPSHSTETLEKMRIANLGRTHTDETKRKMSEKKTGRFVAKDRHGNFYSITREDPRYVSGELVHNKKRMPEWDQTNLISECTSESN